MIPDVNGGLLLECVGGPLDGQWVFLAGGDSVIDVGHFADPQRTPWVGVRPGQPNYLGYYSPAAFVNGATAIWHEFDVQPQQESP